MLRRLMRSLVVFLTFFLLLLVLGKSKFISGAAPQVTQLKHGLTGSYYISTLEAHSDVNPSGKDWYVQVWRRGRSRLPRPCALIHKLPLAKGKAS